MTGAIDLEDVAARWHPEATQLTEVIRPEPSRCLAALLDRPGDQFVDGASLPPLWTALHFLSYPAQRELGPDGHPRDGSFLPPIPHRRRMFGGGRVEAANPLRFGDRVTRLSEVAAVTPKSGRSGALLFVTVRHTYLVDGATRMTEEQDLVYRSAAAVPPSPQSAAAPASALPPDEADDTRTLTFETDPVLLFRFSALTNNAHRIHYDLPYATGVEGLPGLLVHGPLLVILAMELPRRYPPSATIRRLSYRAHRPVTVGEPIRAAAQGDAAPKTVQIRTAASGTTMTVNLEWENTTA